MEKKMDNEMGTGHIYGIYIYIYIYIYIGNRIFQGVQRNFGASEKILTPNP